MEQNNTPEKKESPSGGIYQSITLLPLSKFIEVSTEGNLYALAISGQQSLDDLAEAWQVIVEEYASAIGGGEQVLYLNTIRQVAKLRATFEQVQLCIVGLGKAYCGPLVSKLNDLLSTNYHFNPKNKEEYDEKLRAAVRKSKGILLSLQLKELELEEMAKRNSANGAERPTRAYFLNLLITLSDHATYQITDAITVHEFCERIKRLNEHIKRMEDRANKR